MDYAHFTPVCFSGALAQFLVPGRASLFNDDDTNIHYHLYLLSVRIPFTLDGGVRTFSLPASVRVGITWLLQSKINREGVRYVDTTGGIRIVIAL